MERFRLSAEKAFQVLQRISQTATPNSTVAGELVSSRKLPYEPDHRIERGGSRATESGNKEMMD